MHKRVADRGGELEQARKECMDKESKCSSAMAIVLEE